MKHTHKSKLHRPSQAKAGKEIQAFKQGTQELILCYSRNLDCCQWPCYLLWHIILMAAADLP